MMLELLGDLKEYWFLVIAVGGLFLYFYRKEEERLNKWQQDYFNEILVPFHLECLKNPHNCVGRFLYENNIYDKVYVPTYIFYLEKKKSYEKLQKIMIVDYEKNYPSTNQIFFISQKKGLSVFLFFLQLLMFFTFAYSFMLIVYAFTNFISYIIERVPQGKKTM